MKNLNPEFYAYYDVIAETGEVIYCGKGDQYRSDINKSPKRNRYYNIIANKHKLIRKRIYVIDEDLALKLEDWLMEHYHTWVDDPQATEHACNIDGPGTNGGAKSASKETRLKQSKVQCGKKRSQEAIEHYRQAHLNKPIKEKTKNKIRQTLTGQKHTKSRCINNGKSKSKPIKLTNLITKEIQIFNSGREASKLTGVGVNTISRCCRGVKTMPNFIWEFIL